MQIETMANKIADNIGTTLINSGDQIRFPECPECGGYHKDNPAFVINKETGQYYCHECESGGHISKFLQINLKNTRPVKTLKQKKKDTIELFDHEAQLYYEYSEIALKDSLTDKYLSSRRIKFSTWNDLDVPLKEAIYEEDQEIATYPFINRDGKITAIQKVHIQNNNYKNKERRYFGKKSKGVGILKDLPKIIVAEGLETGLSVRQYLGNDYGLLICGDSGNLKSLAHRHQWVLKNRTQIIIAADNDSNSAGIKCAREVYYKFINKAQIYIPDRPKSDWNDVLIQQKIKEEWL